MSMSPLGFPCACSWCVAPLQYLDELDASDPMGSYKTLLPAIKGNTMRYISILSEAADEQLATMPSTVHIRPDIWDQLQSSVSPR
jgi:hypothetical protein